MGVIGEPADEGCANDSAQRPPAVLSTTRRRAVEVGSDLRGASSHVGWTFALPRRTSRLTVEVAADPQGALQALPGVHTVASGPEFSRSVAAASVDVIDLMGIDPATTSPADLDEIASACAAALASDGVVRANKGWLNSLVAVGLHPALRAWTSPADDPVAVVPATDHATIDHFRRVGRHRSGFVHVLGRQVADPTPGVMMLFGHEPAPKPGPPSWLVGIAEADGVDISNHRWGIWARRNYESQKAVIFLHEHDRSPDEPDLVVKVPRSPAFNHRLVNEAEAIASVSSVPALAPTVPHTVFSGSHAGLYVLGSRGVAGPSMPVAADDDRSAAELSRRVVDWVVLLGAETARPDGHDDLPTALSDVVEQFVSLHAPEAELATFLHRQVDLVAESNEPVPLVVMHGNVTDWNVIVPPEGPLVLVDWEFSEPLAPPLWDLFYFLRMNAWRPTRGWRRRIPRSPPRTDTFLTGRQAPMGRTIRRYCDEVGVTPDVVAPLFHLCWARLCLNEATHRTPDRLADGPFASVLRRSAGLAQAGRIDDRLGTSERLVRR